MRDARVTPQSVVATCALNVARDGGRPFGTVTTTATASDRTVTIQKSVDSYDQLERELGIASARDPAVHMD